MAVGNPVVCVKWGGSVELVGDTGNVIDHPRYDYSETLALKVVAAVEDIDSNLAYYSAKARSRIVEKFSLEKMSAEYFKVYKELCK